MEWCELTKLAGASSLSDVSNVVYSSVLNVKAVVAAFNQEKALVRAFCMITNHRFKLYYFVLLSLKTSTECELS